MKQKRVEMYGFGKDYRAAMAAHPEDTELVYEACVYDVSLMQYASEAMKDKKKLVLSIAGNDYLRWKGSELLNYVSERLKDDEDVVMACMKLGERAFTYASDRIKNSYQLALAAATSGITALECVGEKLRDNKEFVMEVYQKTKAKNFLKFYFVSDRLRDDEDVVRLYCQTGKHFPYASERLRDFRDIALSACIDDGNAFQYVSERLRDDEEFVMEVLKNRKNTGYLRYVSERLCDYKEFALEVFTGTGDTKGLQYVSKRLLDDEEFMLEVMKRTGNSAGFQYVSEWLRDEKKFVLEVCKSTGNANTLKYVSERLRDDEEVIEVFCQLSADSLEYASERIKQKKEFVLPLCKMDSHVFGYVNKYFSDDTDFAEALLQDANAMSEYKLNWVSDRLRGDKTYIMRWCKVVGSAIQYASEELKNDPDVCRTALKHGADLEMLGEDARDDFDIVYLGVKKNGYSLEYASERLKNDFIITLTALNGHFPHFEYWYFDSWDGYHAYDIFEYVGEGLKQNPQFAKIVALAFLKTSYGQKYSYEELMTEPLQVFEILKKERDKLELREGCKPAEVLDFTEVLKTLLSDNEK